MIGFFSFVYLYFFEVRNIGRVKYDKSDLKAAIILRSVSVK
jgi:hypothetical protein